jgi:hypothetical protein
MRRLRILDLLTRLSETGRAKRGATIATRRTTRTISLGTTAPKFEAETSRARSTSTIGWGIPGRCSSRTPRICRPSAPPSSAAWLASSPSSIAATQGRRPLGRPARQARASNKPSSCSGTEGTFPPAHRCRLGSRIRPVSSRRKRSDGDAATRNPEQLIPTHVVRLASVVQPEAMQKCH